MGRMVLALNPGGGETVGTCSDWLWGPPSTKYNGYQVSSLGVKLPGHGVDHTPHLAPRLDRVELYFSSSSDPSQPVLV